MLPDWFRSSCLELADDLRKANANKRGRIPYFGPHDCPYCKAQLETNWRQSLTDPHKMFAIRHCEEILKNGYFSVLTRQSRGMLAQHKIASVVALLRNDTVFQHGAIDYC